MRRLTFLCIAAIGLGALGACREQTSDEPPVLLERNMYDSERYNPQGANDFFADHRNMRQPPAGTMAREYYDDNHLDDEEFSTGLTGGTAYVMTVPPEALREAAQHIGESDECLALAKRAAPPATDGEKNECALIHRGQQRYNIYCVPCHSKVGDGLGAVVLRTNGRLDPVTHQPVTPGPFSGMPDFTLTRVRQMPDGQVFNTITHGLSRMPAYAAQIPIEDRWAIVSYLRALQLSQMAMRHPEEKK